MAAPVMTSSVDAGRASSGARALPWLRPSWFVARPWRMAVGVVILAALLVVVWYLASPLFIRTRLDERALAGGQVVSRGMFGDRDAVHRGSGNVRLERTTDGRFVLQIDEFRVTNGPDLYVYLTPVAAPNSHDDVTGGALQVGRLKASEGRFGYELPAGTDVSKYRAAVIYCYQFRTIFSVAPLSGG
jgi:hypothetical protein